MAAYIKVFYEDFKPKYAGSPFFVKVGYYDYTGALTNITSSKQLIVTLVRGAGQVSLWNPDGSIQPMAVGTYIFRFDYGNGTELLSTQLIVYAIESLELTLTSSELYNLIKQEEPEHVYSQIASPNSFTYLDNQGVAEVLADSYAALEDSINTFYPETTPVGSAYVQEWEQTITGQYNLYNPGNSVTMPILQFLRNLNPSFNPYDLAYAITNYIYLRLNIKIYVYVEEFLYPFSGDYWNLDEDLLGIGTILAPGIDPGNLKRLVINIFDLLGQIPDYIQQEIYGLVGKIIRANTTWSITYNLSFAHFELLEILGPTYKGDLRALGIYCLQFDPDAPENVNGITIPFNPADLITVQIFPSTGTVEIGDSIAFVLIGTYIGGYTQDITNLASWSTSTPLVMQQDSPANLFHTIGSGSGIVTGSYLTLSAPANITVSLTPGLEWIMNSSLLNTDTTLT